MMMNEREAIAAHKIAMLRKAAARREVLYREPELRHLYLEMTLRCNERCLHCGSRCAPDQPDGLPAEAYMRLADEIKREFGCERTLFCVTGGEPLLRDDLCDIMGYIHGLGFRWGMTTNGTLITPDVARRLRDAGLGSVSISIDGLERTHDELRGLKGAYRLAMRGINALADEGFLHALQVTTVLNHETMDQLEPLYQVIQDLDIDSWRVIGVEPIGRALDHPQMLLTAEDQRALFRFIKSKREQGVPVCYGCSHYLGLEYERDVRDWYYLCAAGLYVASVDAQGDIRACLDIPKSPRTVQGNIAHDSFADVWRNRFGMFRRHLSDLNATCAACPHVDICAGGAHHSWDYEKNEQRICMRDVLF